MAGRLSGQVVVQMLLVLFVCKNGVLLTSGTQTDYTEIPSSVATDTLEATTPQPTTTTVHVSDTPESTLLTSDFAGRSNVSSESTYGTMTAVGESTTAAAQAQSSTSSETSTYLYIAIGIAAAELMVIVVLAICLLRLTRCFRQKVKVHDAHQKERQPAHGSLYRKHTDLSHDYCEVEMYNTKITNGPRRVPSTKLAQNSVHPPVHEAVGTVYRTAGNMHHGVVNEKSAGKHNAVHPPENYPHLSVYSIAKSESEGNRFSMASTETTETMVSDADPRQIYFILEPDPEYADQNDIILLNQSIEHTNHSSETTSNDPSDKVSEAHTASDGTDFETNAKEYGNGDLGAKKSMRMSEPVLGFNRSDLRRHSSLVYENVEQPIYCNTSDSFPRRTSSRARRLPANTIGSLPDLAGLPVHEKQNVYGNVSKPEAAGDKMGHEDPDHGHGKRKMHVPKGNKAPAGKGNGGQKKTYGPNGAAPNKKINNEGAHVTRGIPMDSDGLEPKQEHGGGHRVDKNGKRPNKPHRPKVPAPNKEVAHQDAHNQPKRHHEQHGMAHKQEHAHEDDNRHQKTQHPNTSLPVNPLLQAAVGTLNSTVGCMHEGVKALDGVDELNMIDKLVYNTDDPETQRIDLHQAKHPPHPRASASSVSEPTWSEVATDTGRKDMMPTADKPNNDTEMDQSLDVEDDVQKPRVDYENIHTDDDDAIYANSLSMFIL